MEQHQDHYNLYCGEWLRGYWFDFKPESRIAKMRKNIRKWIYEFVSIFFEELSR